MSKCNCGCNSSPCKNLNASDIAKLEFVQGLDESGCPKYENIGTLLPAVHPAATLTNNVAPFSWSVATQSGNIPKVSRLVMNADGSFTMNHGDGTPNVTIPKDCCPTMSVSGNTVTFTNGDGSVVTFTLHPAATLTNNAAPFSWNAVAQTGNVPQSPTLTLTPTGFLFVPGDGDPPIVYTEPASVDTYITGWSIVGNQATITRSDGVSFVQTIPTTLDINVQSFVLSGSNLQLTETDGTVHTVPLPQEVKVNAVSYTPATGLLTISNTDGTNVSTTIDVCATLAVLPNGTAGVAGVSQFLGKDCEWHTLPTAGITAQTPLTANDSTSINFTTSGTDNHTLTGAVIVAPTAGNALTSTATGLFVANDTPLTVVDSPTVDLTASGTDNHTLTAAVKISATAANALFANPDGLYVSSDTVLTANDSATIDFTTSGADQHTLTGSVKISAAAENTIVANADGVYSPAIGVRSVTVRVPGGTVLNSPADGTVLNTNVARINNPSTVLPMHVQNSFVLSEVLKRQTVPNTRIELGTRVFKTVDNSGTITPAAVLNHGTHHMTASNGLPTPFYMESPDNVWFETFIIPPGGYLQVTYETQFDAPFNTPGGEINAFSVQTLFGVNTQL